MNLRLKRLISTLLTFVMCFGVFSGATQRAFAANENPDGFSIEDGSGKNGEFNILFNVEKDGVQLSDFTMSYTVNGIQKGALPTKGIEKINNTYNGYKIIFESIAAASDYQDVYVTIYYNYSNNTAASANFKFTIPPEKIEKFTLSEAKNGSFIAIFENSKSDLDLKDFETILRIDGVEKSSIYLRNYSYVLNYNDRFEISYEKINPTDKTQEIQIDITYKKKITQSSKFILYSNGSTSEGIIGSEYDGKDPSNFNISKIANGEINITFDDALRAVLSEKDFSGEYYLDGVKKGSLNITGVDEDSAFTGKNFTVYFNNIDSTDKIQNVTVLLFYTKESNKKPAKSSYTINADSTVYDVTLSIAEIKAFNNTLSLPTITVAEKGKNTIFPSSKSNIEYIKLELPEYFSWKNLNAKVIGKSALEGTTQYDVKYGTSKGEQAKNILLIGIIGSDESRKSMGSLEISGLEIESLVGAEFGDVKLRVSGAGIPYERFSIANHKEEDKPVVPSYKVVVVDSIAQLIVNGTGVSMDTAPYIQDNRLMLPVSHIAKAFGIDQSSIDWDPINRKVKISDGTKVIELSIGSSSLIVNGVASTMDTTAVIKDNRTFIPMRFLGESLGFEIDWNSITRTATLTK